MEKVGKMCYIVYIIIVIISMTLQPDDENM